MAYKKIALYFKWIDLIVYEIITNQFTPFQVAAHLAHFCASNFSLKVITDVPILQISFHFNFFLLILKTCLQKKELSVYIEKNNIAKKSINKFV